MVLNVVASSPISRARFDVHALGEITARNGLADCASTCSGLVIRRAEKNTHTDTQKHRQPRQQAPVRCIS